MTRPSTLALLITLAALCAGGSASAADRPGAALQFAQGQTSVKLQGKVQGDADASYTVEARAGQTLAVSLATKHGSLNVNVIAPGASEAMFIGSTQGRQARVMLPADGAYRVQVYLMRSAARRHESAAFSLEVAVTGRPLPALPFTVDAPVAGTRFHAVAEVPCDTLGAAPGARCEAGVVRRGRDGTATVALRSDDGSLRRSVLFVQGKPVASDSAQPINASRQGDTTVLRIGTDERYELPDALLIGG